MFIQKQMILTQGECDAFLRGIIFPKLNYQEKISCDSDLHIFEIGKALKQMKNNASPGGLSAAWYKMFWPKIKEMVLASYTKSLESGLMSNSQKKGIIRLLYKGKGSRNELKNWRAIALTNVDYKILAKTLANRLKNVIKSLVHEDQMVT